MTQVEVGTSAAVAYTAVAAALFAAYTVRLVGCSPSGTALTSRTGGPCPLAFAAERTPRLTSEEPSRQTSL